MALPDNASVLEVALLNAWRDVVNTVDSPYPAVKNPEQCPVDFLSLIASERGVLDWVIGDTQIDRRLTASHAFKVHRLAGTRDGLKKAVETLDTTAIIKRGEKPYELNIEATLKSKPLTEQTKARIQARVNTYKSERDTITVNLTRPLAAQRNKLVAMQVGRVMTFEVKR